VEHTRIILRARSQWELVDAAIVELTSDLVALIRLRMAAFASALAADSALFSMRYWSPDGEAEFFSLDDEDEITKSMCDELDDSDHMRAPAAFSPDAVRVSCLTMDITRRGVMWSAYPKHGDGTIETDEITIAALEGYYGAE